MKKLILTLPQIDQSNKNFVGGKSFATAKMSKNGLKIPKSLCITTNAFENFMETTGLRNKIFIEYYRKKFNDMRWEEIWDLSLKIKNMFLNTSLPPNMDLKLRPAIDNFFKNKPVVVRSSGLSEDSEKFSFAGIHESYVNVKGINEIIKHIKLVWASFFSDSAILYRKETGLDINSSKMAVIIQEFINGQKSGVAFTKSPDSNQNMMIEAVYGLNQGLVDGTIEPDRWIISRKNGKIISYKSSNKNNIITAVKSGVAASKISKKMADKSPLTYKELNGIYNLGKSVENIFNTYQDTEWTYLKRTLYCLQSRPITTINHDKKNDNRQWYLSLKRSLENLKQLRFEIEQKLIPEMQIVAKSMEATNLSSLTNKQLANELNKRNKTFNNWRDIYWDKFIPFAHAVRLFGEIYNKQIVPENAYEFTQLLVATKMKSLERNKMLQKLATFYNSKIITKKKQDKNKEDLNTQFNKMLDNFIKKFRNPVWGLDSDLKYKKSIIQLLKQIGSADHKNTTSSKSHEKLKQQFINSFTKSEKKYAQDLLELARISYQLRDDDNIHLGKIEGQLNLALNESKKRLDKNQKINTKSLNTEESIATLKNPDYKPAPKKVKQFKNKNIKVKPRQLTGQPSSEGLAKGKARIIQNPKDVFNFKAGEILVCDAIDPNMTFIVPIAAGIIERRGGMLIHGAIIAREYGLPCITGVPDAVDLIKNGQEIVVDGYLGIVILGKEK